MTVLPSRLRRFRRRHHARAGSPLRQRLRRLSPLERQEEARAFIATFHSENGLSQAAHHTRAAAVQRSLRRFGTYTHSPEELAFGARVAWRNHARCIGRLFWETLEVFDCRHVAEPDAIAERATDHMVTALGNGNINSVISVFAPVEPKSQPAYIESPQLTQYAGYVRDDGSILGDRQNVEATRTAALLGHPQPEAPGAFDLLPFTIRDRHDRRAIYRLPAHAVREVRITHPESAAITELGLKWYAVPCVSSMILTLGGLDYPCAPFNGFYMCTEIASRNLADRRRYDLLPTIARALGDAPVRNGSPFWQDRALTELNRAVLHSFKAAGVTMVDHHTASQQFMEFNRKEQVCGRQVAAKWSWIVPPQASASCEVFDLPMRDFAPVPNYYHSVANDGGRLMPFYGDLRRNRIQRHLDRARRRWKMWRRTPW